MAKAHQESPQRSTRRKLRGGRTLRARLARLEELAREAREPLPVPLQEVLQRAEAVITETRRVLQKLRQELRQQQAASRQVLTGPGLAPLRRPRRRGR
ncbi:MAG TPA: hypothetical protein VGW35_09395 [Methylomirabilota bacterium]|nr:hypothetical protein [Methylomirabilota bacterium]